MMAQLRSCAFPANNSDFLENRHGLCYLVGITMPRTSGAPSHDILEAALHGLEAQREKLDEQIAQVRQMLGARKGGRPKAAAASGDAVTTAKQGRKKRTLTPEARKRIAAAQKKRWAAFRKTQS